MRLDRREALRRMAAAAVTTAGVTQILSSRAFADGGSVSCRPTLTCGGGPLLLSVSGLGKDAVRFTALPLNSAACPRCAGVTSTRSTQYRWTIDSLANGGGFTYDMFSAGSGGSSVSSFSTSLVNPAYFARAGGGQLASGVSATVRLTIRYVCTAGSIKAWRCCHYLASFTFSTGGGSDGQLLAVSTSNGSGSSPACDSPAP